MKNLLPDFISYINKALGLSLQTEPWGDAERMPFYLHETFQFAQCILLNTPCLLLVNKTEREINPLTLAKHIMRIRQAWDGVVLYLCAAVSPYVRRHLIEEKIPFVIPGNQLYLPPLGVDLRELYRKSHLVAQIFSPSTQAVILHALCHSGKQPFTASALSRVLGYSRMTMARAFGEIAAAEVGEIVVHGKEHQLSFPNGTKALWEQTRLRMGTPVKKRLWTQHQLTEWSGVPAGLTALARYTMLAAPKWSVYAVHAAEWKRLSLQGYESELALPWQDYQSCEVELWGYAPGLFAAQDRVDPFSLYLSLQNDGNERIQTALTQMMEQVVW